MIIIDIPDHPFYQKSRPLSDSQAATLYKLKRQSLNMQTSQGFKYKELVRPGGPSNWSIQLVRPAGLSGWYVQQVHPAGLYTKLQYCNIAMLSKVA